MAGPVFFFVECALSLKMRKEKFLKFIVFLVVSLFIVKLLVAGLISTSGFTLYNTKKEILDIGSQNQQLSEEITSYSSFKNIQAKAENLGFKSAKIVLNYSAARSPIAMKE